MKIDNEQSQRTADSASFSIEEQCKPLSELDPTARSNGTTSQTPQEERHEDWRIILYYCYVDIHEINAHVEFHQRICGDLELQGRIRVSAEGINGVLSGRLPNCQRYEEQLRSELTRLVPRNGDDDDDAGWELDVKYCRLRTDLPISAQLFDGTMVKATSCVVSLFEPGLAPSGGNNDAGNQTKKHSKQSNRRKRRQQQRRELQQQKLALDNNLQELADKTFAFPGGQHLSPKEWNAKLGQADDAVLLDCRNVYESNVGYFQAPETQTLLTNTRKYSDLPKVLAQSKDQWVHKKQIFMYCTGGVRCEMASKFVQAMVATEQGEEQQKQVEVFQLHGGIQRYLEEYHDVKQSSSKEEQKGNGEVDSTPKGEEGPCLYRGLNFVFDPRRTDPMFATDTCVGKCCLCGTPHDDYDNGHSPMENREARCCKCRILLLVCPSCRLKVQSCGEEPRDGLPQLFCGVDVCSDYQATGTNPVCAVPVAED